VLENESKEIFEGEENQPLGSAISMQYTITPFAIS